VKVAAEKEAGALGAAMAAAVGTGLYRDLDEAAEAMVATPRVVHPDPEMKNFYGRRFALWQALEKSLAPHWAALKVP
jgi:L-xylulokinase